MPFPYRDIKEYIADLEKEREIVRVKKEVDWNLEAGAIVRRLYEVGQGRAVNKGGTPAVLFENVKDYPGFSLMSGVLSSVKRAAMIIGLADPDKATMRELQERYTQGMEHPIKPVQVAPKDVPCKKNKVLGDEVDLTKLPAPMVHEGDGGRYMCTMHVSATRDPDSGWLNWGMYRGMIHDRRTFGGQTEPFQHIGLIRKKYEDRDLPMPFAYAIGCDPLSLLSACSPMPAGFPEVEWVGGVMGRPLEVVQAETSDLLVPASAQVVIEGIVPPHVRAYEAPHGEYTGYRASPRDLRPVFVVKAITWCDNPVYTFSCMGIPVDDSHIGMGLSFGAEYKREIQRQGLPVKDVNVMPETASCLAIVSIKPWVPYIANRIMNIIGGHKMGGSQYKVLVVDEDVDVFNPNEVLHAFCTRVHPVRSQFVYYSMNTALCPYGSLEERKNFSAPIALYDGTWPTDWQPEIAVPPKSSFKTIFPKEVQEKVLSQWTEYGFKE